MRSESPKTRLAMAAVGDKVKVIGDRDNRNFVVEQIRDDGYIELFCNGRINMTACPSTEIEFMPQ